MKDQRTKDTIHAHKKETIEAFNSFLCSLINSPDCADQKRADLICYWLKDFQQYLSQEKTFDAAKIKSYKRGDVIKVNLGFNVGSEQGGLRYAIVLDKDNKHNSKTITVVPLTSMKEGKSVYERDVSLGRELYNRIKSKYDSLHDEYETQREQYMNELKILQIFRNTLVHLPSEGKLDVDSLENELKKRQSDVKQIMRKLDEKENSLKKIESELHRMKDGSIAKIEQITTISKQRIYDPKKSADVLSGICFSDTAMNKINEKIKDLYIF